MTTTESDAEGFSSARSPEESFALATDAEAIDSDFAGQRPCGSWRS